MEKRRRTYPADERFYVLRDGEALGPHDIETLLEGIDSGELSYEDLCLPESGGAPEPMRDLLDWDDEAPCEAPPGPQREGRPGGDSRGGGIQREVTDGTQPTRRRDRVLYRGHPSILTFPWSSLAFAGGLGGAVWAHPVDSRLALALFAIACGALGYLLLMRSLREYSVTAHRVETVSGLLARSSREARIADIRAINVVCRGIGGWIGIGTVEFYTAGDQPEVEFRKVWAASRIKRLVRELQDGAEE